MIHDKLVKDVMTPHPLCINDHQTIDQVRHLFSINDIHHLPVINDKNVIIGILSDKDLNVCLDWSIKFNKIEQDNANDRLLKSLTALDICSKEVFTVRPTDTLKTCYRLFSHNQFHCLPVINDDGHVIGIITTYDLLKVAYD